VDGSPETVGDGVALETTLDRGHAAVIIAEMGAPSLLMKLPESRYTDADPTMEG
jgi:hypothetical protein